MSGRRARQNNCQAEPERCERPDSAANKTRLDSHQTLMADRALQVRRVRRFVKARGGVGCFVLSLISQSSRRRSELIAMPLVRRFFVSRVSQSSRQRFELIAMPLVNGQPLELVDGNPARPQPLCELLHRGERQPQGRHDRRLCLDPNLDLGVAVGAGGSHRRRSHRKAFVNGDGSPAVSVP
jgi:hypothetical protein